ncbi:MAG: ankyrin repeat domain-containing protein [Cellulophaga sp.]|uniref:ankyrin repeat domain-containing protein n=1 Tax=unclassified Cellulophaga TaxID=2634405 RepID=UPI0026E44C34|nr:MULTISPECIES: ankyrin repeat domain-containing protein [unclassified Cellulophaga]MDO6493065.1 ankyrin repeat domain-containing protein [Cellulophaga sp. 2_MG-2023]MDO6496318.1 ankyrin repeat domain-containing protein [Cellulophaga sp. 3_MG-2023]
MKTLFLTFLLIISTYASAQELNNDIKSALESDNVTALKKHITTKEINNCFKFEESEYTLLTLSIKLNAKSCFAELIAQSASVEKTCNNKTPLMYTAKYNRLAMAKKLVKAGAEITLRNNDKQSALDFAKKYERKEFIEYIKSFNQ